ncbi:hypothetical protein HDU81_007377 [Chytriomyces hyalinus]|nr:hypothetical protein HDU81_007377 [Chytriomyces hyalinus]
MISERQSLASTSIPKLALAAVLALALLHLSYSLPHEPRSTSTCTEAKVPQPSDGGYIHGALLLLAASSAGIAFSMILVNRRSESLDRFVQLSKMFGIGVLLSTAWIHLLPSAFEQFSNPSLDPYWKQYGTNHVGLFALIATFVVQRIEFSAKSAISQLTARLDARTTIQMEPADAPCEETPLITLATPPSYAGNKEITVVLLEIGILFHSAIMGVTLGVSPSDAFSKLIVPICFHQLFEGMALGVLVGGLNVSKSHKRVLWGLYPIATPIAVGIGAAIRTTYNPDSPVIILAQGILEALSAGILFYNTYVELMSEEVVHSVKFHTYSQGFKQVCFLAMYLGAASMAIVGIWV